MQSVQLNQQAQVFEWLHQFNIYQIKQILQIKQESSIQYLRMLISSKQNDKNPTQIISAGYTLCNQNLLQFYCHSSFHYKTIQGKSRKKQTSQELYQNLTMVRNKPYHFNVQIDFIKNSLHQCMMILSDQQLFHYLNHEKSSWFNPKNHNNFATWIVYLFQLEIYQAYKNKFIPSFFKFEFYQQELNIKRIKSQIKNMLEQSNSSNHQEKNKKSQNTKLMVDNSSMEQNKYYLGMIINKLSQTQYPQQVLLEYSWIKENNKSLIFQIMNKIAHNIQLQCNDYIVIKEIEEIQLKKSEKKKKKRNKRNQKIRAKKQQQSIKHQNIQKVQGIENDKQSIKSQALSGDEKIQSKHNQNQNNLIFSNKQIEQYKSSISTEIQNKKSVNIHKKSNKTKNNKKKNQNNMNVQYNQIKSSANTKNKQFYNLDTYLLIYRDQLNQLSNSYEKYRICAYKIIKQVIERLCARTQWQLRLFGSCAAGFALKSSDLDLAFLVQNPKVYSLSMLNEQLQYYKWVVECQHHKHATIPIISLKIDINLQNKIPLPRMRKSPPELISIDIISSTLDNNHAGLNNTAYLSNLLKQYQNLHVVALLLKYLLKVNQLNKPFTGGISSYVLSSKKLHESYFKQIQTIAYYLRNQFQPFRMIIHPQKKYQIEPDCKLHLNVYDEHQNALLKTSAFKIQKIVLQISSFSIFLQKTKNILDEMSMQSHKKKKKIIMTAIKNYYLGKQCTF